MKDETHNNVFYYLMLGVIVIWLVVYMAVMNNSMVSSVPASLTSQPAADHAASMPALQQQSSHTTAFNRKN